MAKINLTPGRIDSFVTDKGQAFLWDSTAPGLGVRATPGGAKAFILQSRFAGKAIRITIGDAKAIPLATARSEARRLLVLIEQGIDPREQKRATIAEQEEARASRQKEEAKQEIKTLMVADAWQEYLVDRKPHWGERNYQDHLRLSAKGGEPRQRGTGKTVPGALWPLMRLPLGELSADRVEAWLAKETEKRATQASLAYRLLKAFLNWCSEHKQFKVIVGPNILTRRVAAHLPKKQAKTDCLQKEQLGAWFAGVRQACNPTVAAYLQGLLLTGARRRELASLKWSEIDFRWKAITIHDKVEGERIIPLTPYFENLLRWIPNRGEYVFSSSSAEGFLQAPTRAHSRACKIAGIEGLTLHGLRRSFGSLSEWVEIPAGIVAQIMGHKPSATAEKHYRVRPLDLLRMWHVKIEAWILDQAGIEQPDNEEQIPVLRVVQGGQVG